MRWVHTSEYNVHWTCFVLWNCIVTSAYSRLPLYGLQPLCPLWPLTPWLRQGIFHHATAGTAHWVFSLFEAISYKPQRLLCQFENPSRSAVWKTRTSPSGTSKQALFESPHFPVLMLALNFSTTSSPHLHARMHWAAAVRWAGELFLWTGKWSIYLTKWLVNGNTATKTPLPVFCAKNYC